MTALAAACALLATSALGTERSLDGWGRVSALPGWRLTPNDYFRQHAADEGFTPGAPSPGGPALTLSFAYYATERIEASVDLFANGEQLRLDGQSTINSVTYGALLGARWVFPGVLFENLAPFFGVFVGPAVIDVSSSDFGVDERLITAYAAVAGASWALSDRWAVTAEYRLMYARGFVPLINGGVNAGGNVFSIGLTTYFEPEGPPTVR